MQDSLLFIPDISGFTRFVNDTEIGHSQHIVAELLEVIIDSDELGLTLSEIEGDAVMFYLRDDVPSVSDILEQAKRTFVRFHAHLKQYETHRICQCGACSTAHELTLKVVAHAGPIQFIRVRDIEKPHGSEVILVHRLLKNQVDDREYALLTESILKGEDSDVPDWASMTSGAEQYEDFGDVGYSFASLGGLHPLVPDPPPIPAFLRIPNPVRVEAIVKRSPDELYEIISNLDLRLEWNTAPTELEYEPDRVNRIGTAHECLVNGKLVGFTTISADLGSGILVYGELLDEAPFAKQLAVFHILEPASGGTRVGIEAHYHMRGLVGRLFIPLLRIKMKAVLKQYMRGIRSFAESRPAPAADLGTASSGAPVGQTSDVRS